MRNDLNKNDLYESVKTLIETEDKHLHLPQQKLFTLFSIGFQYFLYQSTKNPGAYIIRIEDSALADKLCFKAKDPTSRKFLQSLMLPRKLKYERSMFYLDFFHIGSWNLTNEVPKEKIKGALIVKNTTSRPMSEVEMEDDGLLESLPPHYYISMLKDFVPKTITIALDQDFGDLDLQEINFPFIKTEEKVASGVTISSDISWNNSEDENLS